MAAGQFGPFGYKSNPNTWTAVLLSGNDVFFGHVKQLTADRIEMTNVYYVQKPTGQAQNTQALSIVSLVANQIQCPKDDITINRADVAYWEDLQDGSYVVQRLNQLVQTTQACYQPPAATPPAAPAAAQPTAAPPAVATP